jgi:predicted SPOUT superfamily RNA methylase MTH1
MDKKLAIAIPASAISDTPHIREKTSKIGLIGRAAAIFRVSEIIVYTGNARTSQLNDAALMTTLLAYMETPQYLRKRLFKLDPQLQFAGILPPLRTPHHPLFNKAKSLKVGEYREGVVLAGNKDGLLIDIGVDRPVLMRENTFEIGTRLTTRVVKEGELVEVENSDRDQIPVYWGYKVSAHERPFTELFKKGRFDLTIATSKFGTRYADVAEKLAAEWTKAKTVLVAFGAPAQGLFEIARDEGKNLNEQVDFVVNTIPNQGTDTVRTEEAVLGSLAIFNTRFEW